MLLQCLLCQRALNNKLTLKFVLSWAPSVRPLLCQACQQGFQSIDENHCQQCGRQLPVPAVCSDCEGWRQKSALKFQNKAIYTYNEAMQSYFAAYKFRGDYRLRLIFQAIWQQSIQRQAVDLIVPIPVSEETYLTRGFNQVCGWLTPATPVQEIIKVREFTKQRQSKFDRQERLAREQPFELLKTAPKLTNLSILLLDDIYTTGRTIRFAAELLTENGAKSVTGLTLAR